MANAAWYNEKLGEFITPRLKMAWPTLLVPQRIKGKPESRERFTVTGLIPPNADISALEKGFDEAMRSLHTAKWKNNNKLLLALDKTENSDAPALANLADEFPYFIKASANADSKPRLYVVKAGKIEQWEGDAGDLYSGRWAMFGGTFYPYDKGSKGGNFGLNRVILLDHDERLPIGGGGPAINSTAGFEGVDLGEGESASSMFD